MGQVYARLDRLRRYPSEAQRRGDQGVVLMRLQVMRDGRVLSATMIQGSGSAALDAAAADWIARAAPLPAFPAEMTGERLELTVPLRFRLN